MNLNPTQNKFYGELKEVSASRFTFDGTAHEDQDTVTIVTNNVRRFKNNFVMMVDNNKVIYLKEWQIRPIYNHEMIGSAFAVKLNRNFFKTYTWKSEFTDAYFEKEDTFDSLAAVAKEQAHQLKWKQESVVNFSFYEDVQPLQW